MDSGMKEGWQTKVWGNHRQSSEDSEKTTDKAEVKTK